MQLSFVVLLAGAVLALWQATMEADVWEPEAHSLRERLDRAWRYRKVGVLGAALVLTGVLLEALG